MAARMVGIRQEGNPCRMLPSGKGRGARSSNSSHDITGKERRLRIAALVHIKRKKKKRGISFFSHTLHYSPHFMIKHFMARDHTQAMGKRHDARLKERIHWNNYTSKKTRHVKCT